VLAFIATCLALAADGYAARARPHPARAGRAAAWPQRAASAATAAAAACLVGGGATL